MREDSMLKYFFVFCLSSALFFAGVCRAEEWRVPEQPWTYGGVKAPLIDHTLWKNWDRNARYHFVGGFLTGLIFGASQSVGQDFFKKIGGMTINEVLEALDNFYQERPDDGSTVYSVILKAIPQNRAQD
jgi:hypothetical protein